MYNSTEMVDSKAVQLPIDKTRRKRLKVVSACSECRRKKTKCNGEKPCAGCIKTNMDCKYSNSPKSRPSNNRPLAASSSSSSSSSTTTTTTSTTTTTTTPTSSPSTSPQSQQQQQQQASRYYQHQQQQQQQQSPSNDKTNTTIQAIESRLGVIEDILQILLKQQQQQQQQQQYPPQYSQNPLPPHQYQQRSAFVPVEQRNMQVHHSGPYYGDYQNDDDGYNYRQSQTQKRKFDQVGVVDVRLPPPHNYQPSLSESSSTSTTSSICSNSSPKINTIQALLNNENEIKLDYPTTSTKPSAFYRPTNVTTTIHQQYTVGGHPNVY
ncbi:hypothetical protein INT46_008490 [Mucor plumbeus]|uniref:Zn(2)-C6 fungal-type domain-containing protein n=1 Tax=Mucor plumbeus TaxID=97098 RepID=A0A8H7VFQ1_9FUNG|nr:hypothetical protein INT46_008490 [Mucor plumbeus]